MLKGKYYLYAKTDLKMIIDRVMRYFLLSCKDRNLFDSEFKSEPATNNLPKADKRSCASHNTRYHQFDQHMPT